MSKNDIFDYVYGILHSQQYRDAFAFDLKKMLPRVPMVETVEDFHHYVNAGHELAELHLNYEAAEPFPLDEIVKLAARSEEREFYRVAKMSFRSRTDRSAIVYNKNITLGGIPEAAHRYTIGSRSALAWLIDRYLVKTDPPSGIVNDPNDWCDDQEYPRYIVDLIKRVVTVSAETMKIVDSLPSLDLG